MLSPHAERALTIAQHNPGLEAHIRRWAYSPGTLMGQGFRQCPCGACATHRQHALRLADPTPLHVPEYDWPALEEADRASRSGRTCSWKPNPHAAKDCVNPKKCPNP